jgi:hypothetical protein
MDETSLISSSTYAQRLTQSGDPALLIEDIEQAVPQRYRESIFARLRAILLHHLDA